MDKNKLSTLTSEIVNRAETAMTADAIVKAIRETMSHYPHSPIELIIISALLDRLEEVGTNASSIWWRAVELNKELDKVVEVEEVTEDDLPVG